MNEDEEKLQMRADLDRLKKSLRQKDDMIEELEHELIDFHKSRTIERSDAKEKELASKLLDSQIECETKSAMLVDKEVKIESLEKEVDRLEKSNRELANRSIYTDNDETSNSFTEAELLKTSEEYEKCKIDLASLFSEHSELKKQYLTLKEENETAIDHIKSLESHMKVREEELQRLEGELFDMKNTKGEHSAKGNSIFAEAMEAERKLEDDLKIVYREKKCLQAMVKRLTDEKEDAEQRARNATNRGTVIRSALNEADFTEIMRLRQKVREMEKEKTYLWERLFIKMKSIHKKELGSLISGYFDGFRGSIETLKSSHDTTNKKNDELVIQNRCLKIESDKLRAKCENLEVEVEGLHQRLTSLSSSNRIIGLTDKKPTPARVPLSLSKGSVFNRPSVFKSAVVRNDKVSNGCTGLELSMNDVSITPQKTMNLSMNTSQLNTPADHETTWGERRQKARTEKKENAKPQFKFVELSMAASKPLFKPTTLFASSSLPTETDQNSEV